MDGLETETTRGALTNAGDQAWLCGLRSQAARYIARVSLEQAFSLPSARRSSLPSPGTITSASVGSPPAGVKQTPPFHSCDLSRR